MNHQLLTIVLISMCLMSSQSLAVQESPKSDSRKNSAEKYNLTPSAGAKKQQVHPAQQTQKYKDEKSQIDKKHMAKKDMVKRSTRDSLGKLDNERKPKK